MAPSNMSGKLKVVKAPPPKRNASDNREYLKTLDPNFVPEKIDEDSDEEEKVQ